MENGDGEDDDRQPDRRRRDDRLRVRVVGNGRRRRQGEILFIDARKWGAWWTGSTGN